MSEQARASGCERERSLPPPVGGGGAVPLAAPVSLRARQERRSTGIARTPAAGAPKRTAQATGREAQRSLSKSLRLCLFRAAIK